MGDILIAVKDNWLGYGNGNFEYVVRKYGTGMFSLAATASHPHAGFLDAIISAGYLGGVLYILILIYIGLMVRKDFCMSLVCLWMILQFFVETTFFSKIIWPLMAIAEREFEMNK
ncbi:MAG: hypothetical protein HC887_03475 [Desulfobacteraceae bacterium]|nr:hypothetical protein [Desulfobacteraceae bacterium]